jgi:hypothetical protein
MILLAAAWRNTSVKRTTGTRPLSIRSRKAFPGPTEGSWSTSPTRISAELIGIARSSAYIRRTSTIQVSSTISRSHSSGLFSSRWYLSVARSTSRSR